MKDKDVKIINDKTVKIVVYVPFSHCDKIREVIGKNKGGLIGNYSFCSFSIKGIGRFMPNEKANPYIGLKNKIQEVQEERIEFSCKKKHAKKIIKQIKKVHPYEEVAMDIYNLINQDDL